MSSPFLTIVNPSVACDTMPQTTAMEFKHPLDPFQQHAVAAISRDENVLVTAKTGSGKTLVGEYQIAHSLAKGRRVFYTTPIKSLSNQKFHDLKQMFPSVGIMTGDLKFRPDADVVIMTTEILRNLLFKQSSVATRSLGITADLSLDRLDAVVFDECHYINDRDRGAIWEETMILLPREVNLVLLSATIQGPEHFAAWLGDLKQKPIYLISTTYRIVPLDHAIVQGDTFPVVMDTKEVFQSAVYKAWLEGRWKAEKEGDAHKARVADRRRGGYEDGPVARGSRGEKSFPWRLNQLVAALEQKTLLPALVFVFSRRDCEVYAQKIEQSLLDSSDTASVKHILSFHLHRHAETLETMAQYHTLRTLLEKGIAFHHSGLLPILKEIVEILFARGFVKLLFATETFAVGINMPTKTVIFTGYRKYDDATGGHRMLNTDEYIQMAGRAGRRGKDDRGLVLYLPDREPELLEDVRRMMTGARATFQSRMTFGYDFLLKTLQAGTLDWMSLMRQSYWYQQQRRVWDQAGRDAERLRAEQAALAITDEELDGLDARDKLLAEVKVATNAARKKAQAAWGTWEAKHQGPRWLKLVKELGPRWLALNRDLNAALDIQDLAKEFTADTKQRLRALVAFGFLEPFEDGTPLRLTALGTAATEVNEGHEILMPIAFHEKLFHGLPPQELLSCLAIFLEESKGLENQPVELLPVSSAARTSLSSLLGRAAELERLENRGPSEEWSLSTGWIGPIQAWLEGESAETLCAEYGFYAGNFQRVILKMANLLEEWRCLATLAADVEMLESLRGIEQDLLRGIIASESLYLRI